MIKLKKNKELVATADEMVERVPPNSKYVETLYFFHKISLSPPCVFIHLSGTGLMAFLDHCRIVNEGSKIEDLRYMHGRSESLKGEIEVTSVLLAKLREPIPEPLWLEQLPEIYAEFVKTLK